MYILGMACIALWRVYSVCQPSFVCYLSEVDKSGLPKVKTCAFFRHVTPKSLVLKTRGAQGLEMVVNVKRKSEEIIEIEGKNFVVSLFVVG